MFPLYGERVLLTYQRAAFIIDLPWYTLRCTNFPKIYLEVLRARWVP